MSFIIDWSQPNLNLYIESDLCTECAFHIGLQSNKSCRIYRAVYISLLITLRSSQYSLTFILCLSQRQKVEQINKKLIYSDVPFPAQLQRTQCEWNFSALLPCNCCLLLELSTSAFLGHTFWTIEEFTSFFAPLNSLT